MPRVSFIVARSKPGNIIGCENRLPWHLRDDLRNFRQITQNHVVVLGRKTLESIGRPLPNRTNIVLTRSPIPGFNDVQFAPSKEQAMFFADYFSILGDRREYFIIGGAEIYRTFAKLFDKIYLTEVFAKNIKGDATFDLEFDRRSWKIEKEIDYAPDDQNDHPFRFSVLSRKEKYVRKINISEYMTGARNFINYITDEPKKVQSAIMRPRVEILDLFSRYADKESE